MSAEIPGSPPSSSDRPLPASPPHPVSSTSPAIRSHFIRSFYYAFVGLGYLFRTQRNARVELAIGGAPGNLVAGAGHNRGALGGHIFTVPQGPHLHAVD